MDEEFRLKDDDEACQAEPEVILSPEQEKHRNEALARLLSPEERRCLELLLLRRLKEQKTALAEMLEAMNAHWTYEDHFYRFYHGSWKVYGTQRTVSRALDLLRQLLPERKLNVLFEQIMREGTGKEFRYAHNRDWSCHTRPILEAFSHAKFMVEMAVRYADLPDTPSPMPSGWAALLYLFDLR